MYEVKLENFSGPFDLLLKLLDEKKLDIRNVSLVAVTDQFIDFIKARQGIEIKDLAAFLSIAANLLFLKSKAVLPSLEVSEEEEEDAESLKARLEQYKQVREMAERLRKLIKENGEMFSRNEPKNKQPGFYPPENLDTEMLKNIFLELMREYRESCEKQVLPEESIRQIVSLEEKIAGLKELIRIGRKESFNKFVASKTSLEVVVSFLALLELIRQDSILVYQEFAFSEIVMSERR